MASHFIARSWDVVWTWSLAFSFVSSRKVEWFFEVVLNRRTNSFCDPQGHLGCGHWPDSPPMLFSSKREVLLKILLVEVFWSSILYSQWQIWYWHLHWAWGGQAGKSTLARSIAVVTWWSRTTFAQCSCAEHMCTKTDKFRKLSPSVRRYPCVIELPLICPFTGSEGTYPHWLSWHWAALSGKEKFYCLLWLANTKSLEDLHLLFEEQEQNTSYQCLQIESFIRFSSSA